MTTSDVMLVEKGGIALLQPGWGRTPVDTLRVFLVDWGHSLLTGVFLVASGRMGVVAPH